MRPTLIVALAALVLPLLAQDKPAKKNPYYNSDWEEEFVVARRQEPQSKKEAALIKIRYTKTHPLEDCLGKALASQTTAYPATRIFANDAAWTARFPAGDDWHAHLVRADGSQVVFLEPDGKPIEFEAADLEKVDRLVFVSARFDVSLEGDRLRMPPYAFSVAVERDGKDPISEGGAQPEASVGSTAAGKTILAEPRAFTDGEFALSVACDATDAPIAVGVGRAMLRPRVTLDGDGQELRQHVGIYPVPPGMDKREELTVEVGGDPFAVKDFPPAFVRVTAPETVDALSAEVKASVESRVAAREFETLFAWGSMSRPREAIEAAASRKGELEVKGEAETFVFVRAWSPWAKRGGMLLAAETAGGAPGKWDRVVDPPARPYRVINLRGSGRLREAAGVLAPALPFLPLGVLGFGAGSDGSWPQVFEAPGGVFEPGSIQLLMPVFNSSRTGFGAGAPTAGDENFKFQVEPAMNTLDFGTVLVRASSTRTQKLNVTYRDGNPKTTGVQRLYVPSPVRDVFTLSATRQFVEEGETQVELVATFTPIKAKRYLAKLNIDAWNAELGQVVTGGQVTLDGRGAEKTKPSATLTWVNKSPHIFGTILIGERAEAKLVCEVDWDDGDPGQDVNLDLMFSIDAKGSPFSLTDAGSKTIPPGKTRLELNVVFLGLAGGNFKSLLNARWTDPRGPIPVSSNTPFWLQGICEAPPPIAKPGSNRLPEGMNPGAVYRVVIKEKTEIKPPAGSTMYIPTESGWKKQSANPDEPQQMGTVPLIFQVGQIAVIYTLDAKVGQPPVQLPAQIPPGYSVNTPGQTVLQLTTPPGISPKFTGEAGGQTINQPLAHFGDIRAPGGAWQSVHMAELAPELRGTTVVVRDQDDKELGRFSTYYWAPEGAPTIWKGEILKMAFRRIGEGGDATVSISAKNLSLHEIRGDVTAVNIKDSQNAMGKVTRASKRIEVIFSAVASAPGEGEITLKEGVGQ